MTEEKSLFKSYAIVDVDDRGMTNGMRNMSRTPLTEEEIELVKKEIKRIEADESVFVFNDPYHLSDSTCYNFEVDKIFVTRNVFPDVKYGSTHPRDTMSIGAVLAHEYYGHRPNRQEYISDWNKGPDYHTVPIWEDECRASLTAAQTAPGLTDFDRRDLVLDAIYRAKEFGQLIEMNDFMKEAVYGYGKNERNFTGKIEYPVFVSDAGQDGNPQ